MRDALWDGGGTHRSWPGGRKSRPRALIPGEGVREGLAWRGKAGWAHQSWLGGRGVQGGGGGCKGFGSGGVGSRDTPGTEEEKWREGSGKGWLGGRGGCKGFGCGGVGGRGTGPRDGANFATCVVFLFSNATKKKKNVFFLKDALWGGGGTHRSWPGGRGGRPRALIPE